MDEKSLVRRCRDGERKARQEMYEMYAGRVSAVCRRYIRDPERATDVVHDTFLKAWDSLDRFHPRRTGSLGAWLSSIAAHLAVDELRRQQRFSFQEEALDGPEPAVDETRMGTLSVEELIALIADLPEGYRVVFNLFCLDGFSHREIARLLGISEKTSQTQYLKARHKLAALIAAKCEQDEKD